MTAAIHHGDSLDVLKALDAASIDAVVTDPPYGLKFMGKRWDHDVPGVELWREVFRVLKPGAHVVAFFGTRTYHRGACMVEDAGFEIRDQLGWMYGSGFPKSRDVSKAIDKAKGAKREAGVPGPYSARRPRAEVAAQNAYADGIGDYGSSLITAPATPEAVQWQGWNCALKPSWEPILLARKPFIGTVAANVLAHGTGALNVDGCRVETGDGVNRARPPRTLNTILGHGRGTNLTASPHNEAGRWPANVTHDGSDEVVDVLGDAARFFYCPKASRRERGDVTHPTVKPLALMQWLCRLITPPGGVVLDPFAGSGSTLVAALAEGFCAIGIEREAEYVEMARKRVEGTFAVHRADVLAFPGAAPDEGLSQRTLFDLAELEATA